MMRFMPASPAWGRLAARHSPILAVASTVLLALSGCGDSEPAKQAGQPSARTAESKVVKDFHFTAEDTARLLGVPPTDVVATVEQLYDGFWMYSFNSKDSGKALSFGLSISKSVKEAETDMAQYRSHLDLAAGMKPFKDDAAGGVYSDINVGDEAVWTAINGTLNARKGNMTIQVQQPADKHDQIRVAEAAFAKR